MTERKPGRKIDTIIVEGKLERRELDLRFDKYTGLFHIECPMGTWHKGKDLGEVKKAARVALVASEEITWTRWIDLDYQAALKSIVTPHDGTSYVYRDDSRLADRRRKDPTLAVVSIQFHFHVLDVSNGDMPQVRYLRRMSDAEDLRPGEEDAGSLWAFSETSRRTDIAKDMIPYTEARYQAMVAIRQGMAELDRRFCRLFSGDAENVGRRLETSQVALLPAPAKRAKPDNDPINACCERSASECDCVEGDS